jgi:GDP-L-fucose synthase
MSSNTLDKSARIYVAGHTGLVGSSVLRRLKRLGYINLITENSNKVDLTRQKQAEYIFKEYRPEYVILAAAKVGGIIANATYPADFARQNLQIQTNVIELAHRYQVKRLLFLGSSCIYPKMAEQPIREEYLLTGPLEPTNRAYAVAKIAGLEMIRSYNQQYGTQYLGVMPTNLYGPGDNYDLLNCHVLPAFIRKMHEAKCDEATRVVLYGTGAPKREFLFSEDLAEALTFLLDLDDERYKALTNDPLINVGVGSDVTIKELAETVKEIIGFEGDIEWDDSYPDGTPRKLLDLSRMEELGWRAKTSLYEGIGKSYEAFRCK